MSDLKELVAGIDYEDADTATDRTDADADGGRASADTADGGRSARRARPKAPRHRDHPRASAADRVARVVPKNIKNSRVFKDLEPLPEPDFEFEPPAKLRNGRTSRRSRPRPGLPIDFHAAAEEPAAGSDEGEARDAPSASAQDEQDGSAPPAPVDPEAAWKLIREVYKDKPVEFALDIIGVVPDDWQARAMDYVGKGGRLLSVRAGHGVGKSAFCAWLVLWHITVNPIQKTVLTAPTQGQLFDALFAECKFWLKRMPEFIRTRFEPQAEKIVLKGEAESNFVSARTSSKEKPEALAGVHCEEGSVLLIADEASAIPEEVYEAATGSMSGRTAHTILISNPTRNSGLFYQTHHGLKIDETADPEVNVGRWQTMHVSCLNSKRADPAFVKQIIETYGIDSNQYRVRVLGEFATREDDVLIPAALIDAAVKRDIAIDPMAPMIYGLDVARFGDDRTVLVKRRGQVIIDIKWWSKEDTMATTGRVVNEAALDGGKDEIEICVDSIGVGGGVADRLRELGYNVKDVNVAESAAMNPTASRLRDDLWLQARDWFTAAACKIPDHERLKADLKAPTYSFASNGKIVVEPKAMMKKRKLPSPDFADALCLTFAGTAAMVGGRMVGWGNRTGALRRNIRGVV